VLYIQEGWRVDTRAIFNFEQEHAEAMSPQTRRSRPRYSEPDLGEPKHKKRVPPSWYDTRGAEGQGPSNGKVEPDHEGDHHMADANDRGSHTSMEKAGIASPSLAHNSIAFLQPPLKSSLLTRTPNGSLRVNWVHLYKQRRRLEANWHHGRFTNFQLPHPSYPEDAHQECVYAIQFQGKWLVSGSRDKSIRVWDLETKRLWHRPLIGHQKSVLCLQFDPSPEEDVIISGSSDRSVILWKFSTGRKIHQITNAHADSVLNLKFDHRFLVTCSKDRTVKVWNRHDLMPNDEDYPRICKGGGASYPSYIIDLNDIAPNMLEASIVNGHIKSLKAYSLLMTVEGHGAAVNAMQLHGDEIVTASGDRMIKVWNIRNGTCLKTLIGHEKGIACVQFDSRRIISGSNDNTVRIYDHISGAEVACLKGHNNLVRTVQAGFGDPPGADEALRMEAMEVETAFWKARQEGAPVHLGPSALRRAGHYSNTAGSRDPRDIRALGAKIPPGGGGSPWGRIVSGSYDESILIWHKDRDGAWAIDHRLRQADAAANAARGNLSDAARAAIQAQVRQLQATQAAAAAPAPQQPAAAQSTADQDTVEDTPNPPAVNNNPPIPPAPQDGGATAGPSNTTTATTAGTTSTPHPQPAQPVQAPAPAPAPAHPPAAVVAAAAAAAGHQFHPHRNRVPIPTSRVFKVQFDSRKIVCASVDPRIVGWDFACGDEEILEACQFFRGL
jgi:F-box and WD-40 domain protein 1/11